MFEKLNKSLEKTINHLELEFSKLQVGRANPAIVENVKIENYGSMQPLKNIASINILDSQTLSITPWDKSTIHAIAKAINDEQMGLNPQNMGENILIKIPDVTEERRKELVKISKKLSEEAKIGVRNARHECLKDIKLAKENKEITEDDEKDLETKMQKTIKDKNDKIDEISKKKENDIMKV